MKAKRTKRKINSRNRRAYTRFHTPNLWVTENNGDYRFLVPALNISEGGIFLKNRIKASNGVSQLFIHLGKVTVVVQAEPIYDHVADGIFGVGYQFLNLSDGQAQAIRNYVRSKKPVLKLIQLARPACWGNSARI